MKKFILLVVTIFISASSFGQTFISQQQVTKSNGFREREESLSDKKLVFTDTTFSIKLPNGEMFEGTMILFRDLKLENETRKIYQIDGGGIIGITDNLEDDLYDVITINLLSTDKKVIYDFFLQKGNRGDD